MESLMASQSNQRKLLKGAFKIDASRLGMWIIPLVLMTATWIHAAENRPLSLDMKTDIYSAYVWRGMVLDRHAVAQPSAIATMNMQNAGSFSAKVWMNWDLSPGSSHFKVTSADDGVNVLNFVPSYTKAFGPVDISVGNTWYTFPDTGKPKKPSNTDEFFLTMKYKNTFATPSLSVYYDYRSVRQSFQEDNPLKDLYARIALDKIIPLSKSFSVGGTVLLGCGTSHYNAIRYCSPGGSLVDYQTSVYMSYACTDTFSIGTTLVYTGLFGGDLGLDLDAVSPDEIFWGGVNLRWLL